MNHYHLTAERRLLSCLMDQFINRAVLLLQIPERLFTGNHVLVYRAIEALHRSERPVDLVAVHKYLIDNGQAHVIADFVDILDGNTLTSDWKVYASDLNAIPAQISSPLRTCDNTQYTSIAHGDEASIALAGEVGPRLGEIARLQLRGLRQHHRGVGGDVAVGGVAWRLGGHARATKLSTTRFSPALSNWMVMDKVFEASAFIK